MNDTEIKNIINTHNYQKSIIKFNKTNKIRTKYIYTASIIIYVTKKRIKKGTTNIY